jgi:hypothetical protein
LIVTTPISDVVIADLWRFIRGDAEVAEFEQWIYVHSKELLSLLGEQTALQVLASDFKSPQAVAGVKRILRRNAERVSNLQCRCVTLANVAVIDMGEESKRVLATIEQRRLRGEPFWWLWCGLCTRCGQWWLVAQEERQNDVFCLRRLADDERTALIDSDIWPRDFDSYEVLLRLALKAGKRVRFAEPEQAKSLRWTICDLAKARPGIRVSELAVLLNLELDMANLLAKRAVREDGVVIEFDRDTPLSGV